MFREDSDGGIHILHKRHIASIEPVCHIASIEPKCVENHSNSLDSERAHIERTLTSPEDDVLA